MSKESTLKDSQTDWEVLGSMEDEDIDLSEIPEITAEQIAQASFRVGGRSVSKSEKTQVNIYLDTEILEYFKAQAGSQGYETLINEALKSSIRAKGLEAMLRRIIREELKAGE